MNLNPDGFNCIALQFTTAMKKNDIDIEKKNAFLAALIMVDFSQVFFSIVGAMRVHCLLIRFYLL